MNVHLPHNATDAPHAPRLLPEVQQAVSAEIAATRAKAAIFRVEVLSGALLAKADSFHTYAFQLSTVLPVLDDTPGELHIGSQVYPCRVSVVAGLQVTVALATAPAQVIERATLVAQPWMALERLSEALDRCAGKDGAGDAGLSAALFAGESSGAQHVTEPAVGVEAAPLTEGQQHALAAALQWTVSVIAGPVDSGKTLLLSRVAAAHLAAGRRILLLASTNSGIDAFLTALFAASAPAAYADGDLLRCGRSADPAFQDAHLQLLPEHVENRVRADLEQEVGAIDAELVAAVERNQALSVLQKAVALAQRTLEERDSLQAEVDALAARQEESSPQDMKHGGVHVLKERWERVWQRARRLAGRSDRGRRFYRENSERQRQEAYRLAQQLAEAQRRLAEKQAAAMSLASSLDSQLKEYGLRSAQVDAECAQSATQLGALQEKRGEVCRSLEGVAQAARARARLVASTVAHALVDEEYEIGSFDVVLIDDAHCIHLPQLFWAAALAKSRVVLATDTSTLQPWHCATQTVAGRWLGRSLVDHLAGKGARAAPWIALLSERHSIDPQFAEAVSRWFVPGGAAMRTPASQEPQQLQGPRRTVTRQLPARVRAAPLREALAQGGPLVFVDTGALKPWSEPIASEGRVSLGSALAAVGLAQRLHAADPAASIALITPYAAQARLLRQLARDREVTAIDVYAPPSLPTHTVDVVILDTVETPGGFTWSALDDSRPDSQAQALFSCVCAFARQRLVLVGHWKHVRDSFGTRALLRRMLGEAAHAEAVVSAAELVPSERAGTIPPLAASSTRTRLTNDRQSQSANGWQLLLQDVQAAERSVAVWSPQLAVATVERVLGWLPSALRERGAVRVVTVPQGQRAAQQVPLAVARQTCEQEGVVVEERSALAANLVIVDDRIVWECTFPPLGAPGRGAGLRRVEGAQVAILLEKLLSAPRTAGGAADESGFMPYIEAASLIARSGGSPAGRLPREA